MKNALRHCLVLSLLCVALPTSAQPVPPDDQAPNDQAPNENTAAPEPAPGQEQAPAPEQDETPAPEQEQTPAPGDQAPAPDDQAPDAPVDPQAPVGDPIGTAADPDADGPQSPGDTDEDPDELGDEHRPQVELLVADGEIFTGDVVTVTLTALAPALDDISVPSEQEVAPFEILDTDVRTEERPEIGRASCRERV